MVDEYVLIEDPAKVRGSSEFGFLPYVFELELQGEHSRGNDSRSSKHFCFVAFPYHNVRNHALTHQVRAQARTPVQVRKPPLNESPLFDLQLLKKRF